MKPTPTRLLCVDDHAFVAEAFQARIKLEPDMEVVAVLTCADALVREVQRCGADIVLMDIEMPGADPFEALEDLRRHCPDVKAVMLSAYVRDHYLDEAYRAGAWGYLLKSSSPDEVLEGIRRVARGEPAFSEEVERRFQARPAALPGVDAEPPSKLGLLSAREQQILRMIARGMSRTAIAEQLSRSPMTVDNHRKSIMKKLGINDRAELVRYALAEKLVEL